MNKHTKFYNYLSIVFLIFSIGYFIIKLIDYRVNKASVFKEIKFTAEQYIVNGFVQDSTYYFDVFVENKSERKIAYQVQPTCGCTVVGDIDNIILPVSKDTLNISVSTYNRAQNFVSELLLYENSMIIDSLKILMFVNYKK